MDLKCLAEKFSQPTPRLSLLSLFPPSLLLNLKLCDVEESKDLIGETCRLLKDTLSCYDKDTLSCYNKATVDSSADGLDRLSALPTFLLSLLAIAQGSLISSFLLKLCTISTA